jgi:hypothetical protein
VAHTPSAIVRANTLPSESGGSGTSSIRAELGFPGASVSARIDHVQNQQQPANARGAPGRSSTRGMPKGSIPDNHRYRELDHHSD